MSRYDSPTILSVQQANAKRVNVLVVLNLNNRRTKDKFLGGNNKKTRKFDLNQRKIGVLVQMFRWLILKLMCLCVDV